MQITARITRWGSPSFRRRAGDIQNIAPTEDMRPCCDAMQEALGDGAVTFGENDSTLNEIGALCITRCYPWPEGASTEHFPIAFCPFCGESITIDLVEAEAK
jgi:hypothetical protein